MKNRTGLKAILAASLLALSTFQNGCSLNREERKEPSSIVVKENTFSEVRKQILDRGYGIFDEKIADANSSNYLIILPEGHCLTSESAAKSLVELGKAGIIKRIGLENFLGEEGEDLIEETITGKTALIEKRIKLGDDDEFESESCLEDFYGVFARQEFVVRSYGLEEQSMYERSLFALDVATGNRLSIVEPESLRDNAWNDKFEYLKKELDILGIEYHSDIGFNKERDRKLFYELGSLVNDICILERNTSFLNRIKPQDGIVVGAKHAEDLVNRYNGNVIVIDYTSKYPYKTESVFDLKETFAEVKREK